MDFRGTLSNLTRWQRWALGTAIAVVLYAVFGFLVAPSIVISQGEKALHENLGRAARIGEVRINPFALSLTVRDFELDDADGSPFVSFDEIYINFQLSSLFRRAYTFSEIRIVAPFLHIKILRDGGLNFAPLLVTDPQAEPVKKSPNETGPSAVLISLARIEQGRIIFSDFSHATPFEHEISPLDVELRNFGTRRNDESPYSFSATTGAGETLEWKGSLSVVPLRSSGEFSFTGLKPRTGWLYVQDNVFFEVVDGKVDFRGRYEFDARDELRVSLEGGEFHVRDFAVAERETGERAVEIPDFAIQGISLSYPDQQVHVEKIVSRDGRYRMQRLADGSFRTEQLSRSRGAGAAASDEAASSATEPDEPTRPWSVAIDSIALTGYQLQFDDYSTPTPVEITINPINLHIRDLTNDPTRPIQVALDLSIGESGHLKAEGPVTTEPAEVDLRLALSNVDLRPFEPYWARSLALDLSSGLVGLTGRLQVKSEPATSALLEFSGDIQIDEIRTLDKILATELVSWESLKLGGMKLSIEPTSFHLDKLTLDHPVARIVIAPDGTANLATLIVDPPDDDPDPAPSVPANSSGDPAATPVPITIDLVEILGGTAHFEDRTLEPHFSAAISALQGRVEGLSSDTDARAKLALSGELDGSSAMKVNGVLSPLAAETYLDLRIIFANFGMTSFTPYSGLYIGRAIERGKLFLDLEYELDGATIVGENKIFLDQFTLGDDIESPDALNLPVGLAIGLLKDRNGEIHIDLPVRGDVNDPEFSIGGLIASALRNLITKIATSPFSIVSGLVGSSADEMRYVEFSPGSAALESSQIQKLEALAGALAERPSLSLELTGSATSEIDRPALQSIALEEALRRRRFHELESKWFGEKPTSVSEVVLTPEDRNRLIEQAFNEQFDEDEEPLIATALATDDSTNANDPAVALASRNAEMTKRLLEIMPIEASALRALARQRAGAIRDQLVDQSGVPAERIFVLDVAIDEAPTEESTRTLLSLAAH